MPAISNTATNLKAALLKAQEDPDASGLTAPDKHTRVTGSSLHTGHWVTRNTAMLIIHGIGEQLPLETLDQFGRGIIKQYESLFGDQIEVSHYVVSKPDSPVWFDNVLRITKKGSVEYIDLYEYYWANYTEDKAETTDITHWVKEVVSQADKFYSKQLELGKRYGGEFFDKKGNLLKTKYKLLLWFARRLLPAVQLIIKSLSGLLKEIPYIGNFASSIFEDAAKGSEHRFNNIIGDIVVYNVADPKSKYYDIKRKILDGAVSAVEYLVCKEENKNRLMYESVIIAGHSLGSQVGYDAINKLNLLINKEAIAAYDKSGDCLLENTVNGRRMKISDQLSGFITFGSPLDKIAFFLREIVPDNYFLRQQLLDHYHGFKQADWSLNNDVSGFVKVENLLTRLLDDVLWHNYYDRHDYVSGCLDYYSKVTNIDCRFKAGHLAFTHGYYWECNDFFRHIVLSFLK